MKTGSTFSKVSVQFSLWPQGGAIALFEHAEILHFMRHCISQSLTNRGGWWGISLHIQPKWFTAPPKHQQVMRESWASEDVSQLSANSIWCRPAVASWIMKATLQMTAINPNTGPNSVWMSLDPTTLRWSCLTAAHIYFTWHFCWSLKRQMQWRHKRSPKYSYRHTVFNK